MTLGAGFLGAFVTETKVNDIGIPGTTQEPMRMRFAVTASRNCRIVEPFAEIGMTFEPSVCHYAAKVGNANLRLSGYAISEELDQPDLYVSLYDGVDEITPIPDAETTRAAEQCSKFLTLCVDGKLASKMDESSDA